MLVMLDGGFQKGNKIKIVNLLYELRIARKNFHVLANITKILYKILSYNIV